VLIDSKLVPFDFQYETKISQTLKTDRKYQSVADFQLFASMIVFSLSYIRNTVIDICCPIRLL
jgi:hypothetical protein